MFLSIEFRSSSGFWGGRLTAEIKLIKDDGSKIYFKAPQYRSPRCHIFSRILKDLRFKVDKPEDFIYSPWLAEIDKRTGFIIEQILDPNKTPARVVKKIQNLPLNKIYEKLLMREIAHNLLEV